MVSSHFYVCDGGGGGGGVCVCLSVSVSVSVCMECVILLQSPEMKLTFFLQFISR